MPKFRKRPVVVNAQQWWPPDDPRHDPTMLVRRKGASADPPEFIQIGDLYEFVKGEGIFHIRTREGDLRVNDGDWIITGIMGEKYPCNPDIFEATYEPVAEPTRAGGW